MGQRINVTADVEVPEVPNFLRFSDGSGTIDIADVTDDALRGLGSVWVTELLNNANTRRIVASNPPTPLSEEEQYD